MSEQCDLLNKLKAGTISNHCCTGIMLGVLYDKSKT